MGFKLTVNWQSSPSEEGEFNRDHEVKFGTGQSIQASSAPEYKGNADKVNPEESLLAALSFMPYVDLFSDCPFKAAACGQLC